MNFTDKIKQITNNTLRAIDIHTLQVNISYHCNLSCSHCHYECGPERTEVMSAATMRHVLAALDDERITTLDITGGSPETNPILPQMIKEARAMGKHVIVRSNLTILSEADYSQMPQLFRDNNVEIIASLPCYTQGNVEGIRGTGSFAASTQALRALNALGYGNGDNVHRLNLVYNPGGGFMPPEQLTLQAQYKKELMERENITFNSLYTFTNMPIGRFRDLLTKSGELEPYMNTLKSSFNPCTLQSLMCRGLLSVSPEGNLHDCDFNQALRAPLAETLPQNIETFNYDLLAQRAITTGEHCYACTAGAGST
jgi:radical SAM/Cys-rich protein